MTPTGMEEAVAAGDGTLHGAIDHWQARALKAEAAIKAARGQLDVAVDLLRSCLGPLEVSAAVIESDDSEQMEALIESVKRFVVQSVMELSR